jgi:hypothetical protein
MLEDNIIKTTRLLGIMIDDIINFNCHISALSKRIASKTHLLKKSAFMFDKL